MKTSSLVLGEEVRDRQRVVLLVVRRAEDETERLAWRGGLVPSAVVTNEDVLVGTVTLGHGIHE